MLKKILSVAPVAGLSVCLFTAVSCKSNKSEKPEPAAPIAKESSSPQGMMSETFVEGEAGRVIEETFTATATVRGVDNETRKVTLESEDGISASFKAPPEMQNIDQLKVGDRVKATMSQQIIVFVDSSSAPGASGAALVARAPKGAKPGAIVAETFEVVSTIKSLDPTARKATLEFSDGSTKTVPVRKDVDMSKYKVGDSVVIRVTEQIKLLVETP